MPFQPIALIEVISAFAAAALVHSTLKMCKASGIQYLIGVPLSFSFMTIAFSANAIIALISSHLPGINLLLSSISLLTQMYGLLFLALTYARRTRLKLIGESISIELAIPSIITVSVLAYALNFQRRISFTAPPTSIELPLRAVMAVALLYLIYETNRNWNLTKRASQGVVAVGFALLLTEQLGFILAAQSIGDIPLFVGYQGRILGLFVLVAVTHLGIQAREPTMVLRRMGLTAPAH